MENTTITPEMILANYSDLNKANIIEAMKEFAGIKVIEATGILLKDFPTNLREQAMIDVDVVLENIL